MSSVETIARISTRDARPGFGAALRPRVILLLVLLFSTAVQAYAELSDDPDSRSQSVVAVGDVHGDFDDFVAILQKAQVIDAQHHWVGGRSTFVQVGDLLDRGPKPRQVLDLLMSLEPEAEKSGGRVVSLLGNHEVMNMMGDLRYVTADNYASFADSKSEDRRRSAYHSYKNWRSSRQELLASLPPSLNLSEADWMARHPPGFVEQREAFGPNGKYGKWLRRHSAVARVGRAIFVHGGISPAVASLPLDRVNTRIRDELSSFDTAKQYLLSHDIILPFFTLDEMAAAVKAELQAELSKPTPVDERLRRNLSQFLALGDWLTMRTDGPLWFRGYNEWSDQEGTSNITTILQAYEADCIVVGHTVQPGGRVRPRFGGKVFLIDTGMLSSFYPGGRASALEIHSDKEFAAEYMDERVVLQPSSASAEKISRLSATVGPQK